jgi:hypothetical protein
MKASMSMDGITRLSHSVQLWGQAAPHSVQLWGQAAPHSVQLWGQVATHSVQLWGQAAPHSVQLWTQAAPCLPGTWQFRSQTDSVHIIKMFYKLSLAHLRLNIWCYCIYYEAFNYILFNSITLSLRDCLSPFPVTSGEYRPYITLSLRDSVSLSCN